MRVQLSGRLKVDIGGHHATPALRGMQGRALLAYLILNRPRAIGREELVGAIWPQEPPTDAGAALRTQLSHLRAALGRESVVGRSAIELRLPDDTWVDVEAADRAIEAAGEAMRGSSWRDARDAARAALKVAEGPFLPGFAAPWADQVRGELAELELRCHEVIARAGIELGGSEVAVAERSARTLIRLAPFRETGYMLLMRAQVASGKSAEALRTYDELRRLLNAELGSAPGAEVQELHRELLG